MNTTRRGFLEQGAKACAGLTLAFRLPGTLRASAVKTFAPNAYIRITTDNVVTLWLTRSEMGQGARTALAAILADELEVELSKVKFEQATPGGVFQGIRLRTAGSGTTSTFFTLRKAAASAREMLISAAAQKWSAERASCQAREGSVIHPASGRELCYGDLAETAAQLPAPTKPVLKDAKDFRLIGRPVKRIDGPAIVHGQAIYGFDVQVPGMLVAVMERCPYLGGKLASLDCAQALAVPGVRNVVPIRSGISTGVAVAADNTWAAMKGRAALKVNWDKGPHAGFDSEIFTESLKRGFSQTGYPIRREGYLGAAMADAGKHLEAVYEFPFQAHAPLETMNCVAHVRNDSCEIWAPTQTPDTAQVQIAKMLGVPAPAVTIHTPLLGGGFGRRLFIDYVEETVELSKAIGKPVQLVWTRADDMRNGFFQPASVEQLSAALDAQGNICNWSHKSVGSDLSMFGLPTATEMKDLQRYAKDESPWGAFDTPYNFPVLTVDYVPMHSPVPSGAWRAVEYPSRVFARESFLDEVAHAAGRDPLQLRIDLLQPGNVITLGEQKIDRARMIRVLEEARKISAWTSPLVISQAADRLVGRGLAMNIYHGDSYMVQVAEVSIARDLTGLRVHRILCVFDCGLPINPAGLEGQVESGITWGLSATLHGKITLKNGQVEQSGYHDFRVMRMDEMPVIETHILSSTGAPGGFGEHPVPPVAPAVANAVFAATGKRLRRLPLNLGAVG